MAEGIDTFTFRDMVDMYYERAFSSIISDMVETTCNYYDSADAAVLQGQMRQVDELYTAYNSHNLFDRVYPSLSKQDIEDIHGLIGDLQKLLESEAAFLCDHADEYTSAANFWK